MRVLALLFAFALLPGCLGEEPATFSEVGEMDPVAPTGESYRAYDGNVGFTAAGEGADRDTFEVQEGWYNGLRMDFEEDSVWSGDLRLWVTAPSGKEYVLQEGAGGGGPWGIVNTGTYSSGRGADYEPGTWTVSVRGSGSADMHVIVDVE